ncbi:putative F-box domain, leucine-rich repeat domain superfamily, F-box-like domain superfamily [Helianthus annuus]|uniref:F-box domain, leucine-rich repeat domain superfamily, F-box-like domain superfamily n=1 Tax=Helianthus annuus TaxID=4232 RepID=A0A251UNT3_HELAN|nr:F-box/LRR-repeat protein 25 [Helianthus annuus]KAF5810872.1 putative F-box domain, leucine-rich repeat domain superfamily, F-box-like domain superfamily [Helianthus annuus]KAJ0589623.1 putative F-box domain, leucine-rich repeat domain superfamily, F-box-like domain superfamily [Helianthus annuus]KAJ0761889.1 putative F-box domain-containing protein [Helianthus annuus]KAJ0931992.1 putative F-box domain, leucine-rich repeat domain superfamily, F-box-like domain superfamily [Helianthus annuus]
MEEALKRIRFEEEEDEDRMSELPDSLLVEILSRLPSTKDAIRTTTLSKRWQHLWTAVTNLNFRHPDGLFTSPDFFSFVDKTLTQRPQSKLNKLTLVTRYGNWRKSRVHNWIRYAVNCNVEDLHLMLWEPWEPEPRTGFPLDDFVFIGSCFTHLTLAGCAFNPTGAISWKNLRSLRIIYGNLDEDLIENILSGSPVLETLVLNGCYGYRRLNITSKSVKNLVFSSYLAADLINDPLDVIEINAPNILSLKIEGELMLWKILLLNVSSLVEADLDYRKPFGHFETTREEADEEMLKEFILNLRHVKDLKIRNSCSKVLDCLKAKGFISPSNLKVLDNGPAGNELQQQVDAATSSGEEDGKSNA